MGVSTPTRLGSTICLIWLSWCDLACTAGGAPNARCSRLADCSNGLFCTAGRCSTSPTTADPICGNAIVEVEEACDDGNTSSDDGCSSVCTQEGAAAVGPSAPPKSASVCGNGSRDAGEGCDDGNQEDGDGCSARCFSETGLSCSGSPSVCVPVPAAPAVEGESTTCPKTCRYRWNTPAATDHFLVRSAAGAATSQTGNTFLDVAPNNASESILSVQACNAGGACSEPTQVRTPIAVFEQPNPRDQRHFYRHTQRVLTRTQLGNIAAVVCQRCATPVAQTPLNAAQSLQRLNRALAQGADVLDVSVAHIEGALMVSESDNTVAGIRPRLAELLDASSVAEANALLALRITEADSSATPEAFALSLLNLLDTHRSVVRNGRPLFIHGEQLSRPYLMAILQQLPNFLFLQPYVRVHRIVSLSEVPSVAAALAVINEVINDDLHGVELDYRSPSLLSLLQLAHRSKLLAGVHNISGPGLGGFADVWLAALRNEADWLSSDYRSDHARALICEISDAMYLSTSQGGQNDSVFEARATTPSAASEVFAFAGPVLSDPTEVAPAKGFASALTTSNGFLGLIMSFTGTQSVHSFAHNVGVTPTAGYLVTSHVRLTDLTLADGQQMTIVSKDEVGGFSLDLIDPAGNGDQQDLRFLVTQGNLVNAAHRYPVTGGALIADACGTDQSPAQLFSGALNTNQSYLIVGTYTGSGQVLLHIDGRCAAVAAAPTLTSNPRNTSSVRITVGGDPKPPTGGSGDVVEAEDYFTGQMQQASAQVWVDHSSDANRDDNSAVIRPTACSTARP